ncbi:MAG: hypothetical protein IR153_10225 [Flavobacterium sp.]|nr:hypothetical protein [Flavobacterium sp.]
MKRGIAILVILLVMLSCDSAVVSEYNRDFPDNKWPKNEVKSFKFNLKQDGVYDLEIDFSHGYAMPSRSIPIHVAFAGKETNLELVLTDNSGKPIADCLGDYCDLRQKVLQNQVLKAGSYTLKIKHEFPHDYLPNVTGIGIRLTKSSQVASSLAVAIKP